MCLAGAMARIPLYDGKECHGVQSTGSFGDMPDRPASQEDAEVQQRIREAGERARAEAEARRKAADEERTKIPPPAKESGGRDGPEPVRYGDWEVNGVASDF
jgi:hypothetical protein